MSGALQDMKIGCHLQAPRKLKVSLGHIRAAGLGGERVTGECKGTCPRSAADFLELAGAALALQLRCVPQATEQGRLAVKDVQGLPADVARRKGEKSAGKDISSVGDEEEPLAVIESARGRGRWNRQPCLEFRQRECLLCGWQFAAG